MLLSKDIFSFSLFSFVFTGRGCLESNQWAKKIGRSRHSGEGISCPKITRSELDSRDQNSREDRILPRRLGGAIPTGEYVDHGLRVERTMFRFRLLTTI
jgi:hypothetical protein